MAPGDKSAKPASARRAAPVDPSTLVTAQIESVFNAYREARLQADKSASFGTKGAVASYVAASSTKLLDEAVARHSIPETILATYRAQQEALNRLDMFESARRRGVAILSALGVTAAGCLFVGLAAASSVIQSGQTLVAKGGALMLAVMVGVTIKGTFDTWSQQRRGNEAERVLASTVYPAEQAAFRVIGGSPPVITWGRALWFADMFVGPLIGFAVNLVLWGAFYAWTSSFVPEIPPIVLDY